MPKWLENIGEGFAKHLGVKPGSKRYNAIKYGTMRAHGWKPGNSSRVKAIIHSKKSKKV